ncbi:MAG: WavE lipopolysaccharide synthesis family protein [Planctomycetia bacterium]|nr:WavE lipopolysaccharide synthesis family protein [Planctomycetia bacterium]
MITASELSVVVQGPINSITRTVVESVRRFHAQSEIILSTWEGADTSSIDADIVLKNEDPGVLTYGNRPTTDNVNRQIVSTLAGLRAASRPFAIKLRTDCVVSHSEVLKLFDRYPERAADGRIFRNRIVCCTQFCRDPRLTPLLFHPSDVFQFGRTEDLLKAWDVPLRTSASTRRFAAATSPKALSWRSLLPFISPLVAEQYLWLEVLEKSEIRIPLEFQGDWRPTWVKLSDRLFVNNFVPYPPKTLGIELPTHFSDAVRDPSQTYSHDHWKSLNRLYCRNRPTPWNDLKLILASSYRFFGFSTPMFWARPGFWSRLFRIFKNAVGLNRANS